MMAPIIIFCMFGLCLVFSSLQCMLAQGIIITKAKCLVALEQMSHNIKFPNKRKYLVYLWFHAS